MAFNEKIKKKVREKSAYTCCVCRDGSISIEIHHIIPQEEGGADDFENAVPLCPKCHSDYGSNSEKRARIKETRDWWYKIVKKMYGPKDSALLEKISTSLEDLPEIKKTLSKLINQKIDKITPLNAPMFISNILSSTSAVISGVGIKTVYDKEPSQEEIEAAGDEYIQQQIDIARGK